MITYCHMCQARDKKQSPLQYVLVWPMQHDRLESLEICDECWYANWSEMRCLFYATQNKWTSTVKN